MQLEILSNSDHQPRCVPSKKLQLKITEMRGTLLLVTCLVASTYSKAVNKTKECSWNTDCPENFLCNKSECLDPCSGLCGSGAFCEVLPDTTRCSCSKGLFGDPYVKCGPEEDFKDTVEQKPIVDRCRGACPPSARCILGKELNCICMEGTSGDPFSLCLPLPQGDPPLYDYVEK